MSSSVGRGSGTCAPLGRKLLFKPRVFAPKALVWTLLALAPLTKPRKELWPVGIIGRAGRLSTTSWARRARSVGDAWRGAGTIREEAKRKRKAKFEFSTTTNNQNKSNWNGKNNGIRLKMSNRKTNQFFSKLYQTEGCAGLLGIGQPLRIGAWNTYFDLTLEFVFDIIICHLNHLLMEFLSKKSKLYFL